MRDELSKLFRQIEHLIPASEARLYGIGIRVANERDIALLEVYLPELVKAADVYQRYRITQSEAYWRVNADSPAGRTLDRLHRGFMGLWAKRVRLKYKYMGKEIRA